MHQKPSFHWQPAGPTYESFLAQCRTAESHQLDSIWLEGIAGDPLLLAQTLALDSTTIHFTICYRPGLLSPVTFVQQVNTVAAMIDGRIRVALDTRYQPQFLARFGIYDDAATYQIRCCEFLAVCHAFWRGEQPVDFQGSCYHIVAGRLGTPFLAPDRQAPLLYFCGVPPCGVALDCLWSAETIRMKQRTDEGSDFYVRLGTEDLPERSNPLGGGEMVDTLVGFFHKGYHQFCLASKGGDEALTFFCDQVLPHVTKGVVATAPGAGEP